MSRRRTDRSTLAAVAARAGVSTMTVSNVVNGAGRVSEATRARVLSVIEALGYVPNLAARKLVGARATRLGLLYPAVDSVFMQSIVAAVSTEAASRGLQLLPRAADPALQDAKDGARDLIRSGADALLLIPPFAEQLSSPAARAGLDAPMAAISTAGPLPGLATVRIDNRAAARAITELLISKGHVRIGLISGPADHSDSVARREGHRDALSAHGLPKVAELEACGAFTFASGRAAAERLLGLDHRPTAIVAGNDEMAAGVLWAAHRRGLKLPDELAVTGFDDTMLATRVWPTLTSVRQPTHAMVAAALDLLTARLTDSGADSRPDIVVGFEVIERSST